MGAKVDWLVYDVYFVRCDCVYFFDVCVCVCVISYCVLGGDARFHCRVCRYVYSFYIFTLHRCIRRSCSTYKRTANGCGKEAVPQATRCVCVCVCVCVCLCLVCLSHTYVYLCVFIYIFLCVCVCVYV